MKPIKPQKTKQNLYSLAVIALMMMMHVVFANQAASMPADTSVSKEIQSQLNDHLNELGLFYPISVKRFYTAGNFQPAWIGSKAYSKQTGQAMMLLDCVLQYGLAHDDYHPGQLTYGMLRDISEHPDKVSTGQKARFDMLLSDAMITLMNNMHYGKLNPEFSADKIDHSEAGLRAENVLESAIRQDDFMKRVEGAQPQVKAYADLQDHMRQLEGVQKEDCYITPEADVRKMAINMERLRWAAINEKACIQVNVPTYTLKFVQPDTTYEFRVVVGKPEAPTPSLSSVITYFTTYPEWKIPQKIFVSEILPKALKDKYYLDNSHFAIYDNGGQYIQHDKASLLKVKRHPLLYYARQSSGCDNALGNIVFRFLNIYDIYLHDTPEQQLFKKKERAFSHSCIRVENAQYLAELLLKYNKDDARIALLNKAMRAHLTKNISLKNPVPIIITYLTCEVKEGQLINYKDIYDLDKSLEMALYNTKETLTVK